MRVSASSPRPRSFPPPERRACKPPSAPPAHCRQVAAHFRPRGRGSAHGPGNSATLDPGSKGACSASPGWTPGRRGVRFALDADGPVDRAESRPSSTRRFGWSAAFRPRRLVESADWFAALLVPVDRFGRVDFSEGPAGVPQSGRAGADRRAGGHDSRPRARREPSPADSRRKPGHAVPRLASGPKANEAPGGTAVPFAPRAGALAPLDPGVRGGVSAFPGGVSFRFRDGQGAGINDASRSIGAGHSCS